MVLWRDSGCDESRSAEGRSALGASFLWLLSCRGPGCRAEGPASPRGRRCVYRVSGGSADEIGEGSRKCDELWPKKLQVATTLRSLFKGAARSGELCVTVLAFPRDGVELGERS